MKKGFFYSEEETPIKNGPHKSTHGVATFVLNNGTPTETMNVVEHHANVHLEQVLRDDLEQTPKLFDQFSKTVRNMPAAKIKVGPDVQHHLKQTMPSLSVIINTEPRRPQVIYGSLPGVWTAKLVLATPSFKGPRQENFRFVTKRGLNPIKHLCLGHG